MTGKPTVPKTAASSISTFLTNIHLLDLNRHENWPSINAQTFTRKNTLENEKTRIHCTEWALFHLFNRWDPEGTQNKLKPFFPAYESLQSLNLRAALFRWLNELKKNEILGKEVIIRKTMLDDCKGDKVQDVLAAFSAVVLRQALVSGPDGRGTVAGRLACAKTLTPSEHASLLPLAIAHRASLTAVLRRKRDLRTRYQEFATVLDAKEQELDQRFETIVQTQDLLDGKTIPDQAVSRISTNFEKHWQGDVRLATAVTRHEGQEQRDPVLEQPFSEIWSQTSHADLGGPITAVNHGILHDLDKRVADQEVRLNKWKTFKASMEKEISSVATSEQRSPVRSRAELHTPHFQKQKNIIFSPRKSPRKSTQEAGISEEEIAFYSPDMPTEGQSLIYEQEENTSKVHFGSDRSTKRLHMNETQVGNSPLDVKAQQRGSIEHTTSQSEHVRHTPPSQASNSAKHINLLPGKSKNGKVLRDDEYGRLHNHDAYLVSDDPERQSNRIDKIDDDDFAEQTVSTMLKLEPTPVKSKLSLAERTRCSILTSTKSGEIQAMERSRSPPVPSPFPLTKPHQQSITQTSASSSLLDRTRQSISLAPKTSKASRKSINDRRTSKAYPTNQFETPKKQMAQIQESTPPELLFSPKAGYDSVFKSRPKVGFSPVGSPVPHESPSLDIRT